MSEDVKTILDTEIRRSEPDYIVYAPGSVDGRGLAELPR